MRRIKPTSVAESASELLLVDGTTRMLRDSMPQHLRRKGTPARIQPKIRFVNRLHEAIAAVLKLDGEGGTGGCIWIAKRLDATNSIVSAREWIVDTIHGPGGRLGPSECIVSR